MKPLLKENKITLALATPIMAGQLGQMLLGLADTLMIGRVGTVELAASAFVNVLFHIPIVLAIGLTAAISVQISHAHGAQDDEEAAQSLRHGLILSTLCGFVMTAILLCTIPVLHLFRQPAEIVEIIPSYLIWIALSIIPMVPTFVFKSFAESKNHPWPVFWIMIAGVGLNILLNYLLIFGNGGFPAMGLAGAGIATLIARVATLLGVWIYIRGSAILASSRPQRWLCRLEKARSLSLLKMATPISGQVLMEYGAFATATLLVGQFGSHALAAHQIALTCAATTFMLPLGLSMALTIRVGHTLGAGEKERCWHVILSAHATAFLVMLAAGILFISCREWIAAGFSQDPKVIQLAATLLIITAAFQIFDAGQIVSMGALRGLKDVNIPAAIVFACCWLGGLPLGTWLAFGLGHETVGQWWGLAAGLALTAIALTVRLVIQLRQLKFTAQDPAHKPEPDTVV
ncbi:MAG: MATE family efflux transporter [Verrucomicrobiota bacterium]